MKPPTDVLLVEDDTRVADSIIERLSRFDCRVHLAGNLAAARELLSCKNAQVIILDIGLPDGNGAEFASEVRSSGYDAPILMLTAHDATADRVRGLRSGADDYLCKPFAMDELVARLEALLRRARYTGRHVLTYGDVRIDLLQRKMWRRDLEATLSARELELLAFFVRHPEQVITRERLLEEVWGDDAELDSTVVSVYVNYLRNKLERGQHPRLIHTIRGAGFMLLDGDPEEFLRS